jgi:hypothetical protein
VKNRNWLTKVLASALVIVWGAIVYQIAAAVSNPGKDQGDSGTAGRIGQHSEPYEYRTDVRDPFGLVRDPVRSDSLSHRPAVPPFVQLPPLKLTGIMAEGKQKTAIIEESSGMLRFVRQGDTLWGVKVLKIEPGSVKYLFQKQQMAWILEDESGKEQIR